MFLSAQPLVQLALLLILNAASAALTLLTRPFVYRLLNYCRVLVELVAILLVITHLVFYCQVRRMQGQQPSIDEELV